MLYLNTNVSKMNKNKNKWPIKKKKHYKYNNICSYIMYDI